MVRLFISWHKWVSVIFIVFILLFPVTGIILNHRKLFSHIDVSRRLLPAMYEFNNWNNAAVKGTEKIGHDSVLIYGNIGIWLTDTKGSYFKDFNHGLPSGMDNRKICKIKRLSNGRIIAGTLFGLYSLRNGEWARVRIPTKEKRVVDISEKADTVILLTRSHLLKTVDFKNFEIVQLPPPINWDHKVSLFKTLWMLHSGELFGIYGKIFVDLLGIIFIFFVLSGLYYFIGFYIVKFRKNRSNSSNWLNRSMRFLLKWHNRLGWMSIVFLLILTVTGMFLRPPLLAFIAWSKIPKIPFTTLGSGNPWYDRLRGVLYVNDINGYIVATNDGLYYADESLKRPLRRFRPAPPINVMGITVFKKHGDGNILVGSFDGLFEWDYRNGFYYDYIRKIPGYRYPSPLVTGFSDDIRGDEFYFDYDKGAKSINGRARFPQMPERIKNLPMSLWNAALEIHTGRAYVNFFKEFTILYIPLAGLVILSIISTGFVVWWKLFR